MSTEPRGSEVRRRVLEAWRAASALHGGLSRLSGQQLIEPYFVTKFQDTREVTLLIATVEGASWYDQIEITDCAFCLALGMVRRGATVFDCGANQGLTSIIFADAVGDEGKVYAFDPFPLNVSLIRINATLNDVENIQPTEVGLSDAGGHVVASTHRQNIIRARDEDVDTATIALARIDDYAHWRPDLLKIDVEGAEIRCLRGAREVLSTTPSICLELHPEMLSDFGNDVRELHDVIDFERYSVFIRAADSTRIVPYQNEGLLQRCWLFFVPRDRPPIRREKA